ncbi:MAG: carbon-nitrogen family hydrolase [Eubacteriales bacterium]|nr:carbon-nitrogen family hydrolase [Eubacteriales bacterium]
MKIACAQMDVLPGKPEENYILAEALIRKAARKRPDVILLPETWNTGFAPEHLDPAQADGDGARTKRMCSALAKELKINLLAGSVTTRRADGSYNTAYGFDRAGELICCYDKTHLFSPLGEKEAYQKGGTLARFTLDGVRCALMTCYDLRFPELARTLALPGLDVLFIVSQWPRQRISHLETLAKARAIENQLFVAVCNACGTAYGTKFGGRSMVIDPLGKMLKQAGTRAGILYAEMQLDELAPVRKAIPVFSDRRPELYRLD